MEEHQHDRCSRHYIHYHHLLASTRVSFKASNSSFNSFAQNAVPQTNNIAVSTGASITYFVLSFVTLALLFCTYEIVNYGQRQLMMFLRIISMLYGLALIVLGIILLAIELGSMAETCSTIWVKMS